MFLVNSKHVSKETGGLKALRLIERQMVVRKYPWRIALVARALLNSVWSIFFYKSSLCSKLKLSDKKEFLPSKNVRHVIESPILSNYVDH